MRRKLFSFAWIALACVVMGALPATVQALFGNITARHFAVASLMGVVCASFIAIPCWLMFGAIYRRVPAMSTTRHIVMNAAMLAFFGVAGCFVANLALIGMGLIQPSVLWPAFRASLRICLLITFTLGALTAVISSLQSRLRNARDELHEREIGEERERKMAAEARYASLESRVHPHFLFNTLNSISALVREDPAQAERTIERLASLLRFSLDSELAGLVTVREELRVVSDYLEIEKIRFGKRLRYSVDANPAALDRTVPALSVQTLVENSVKYAVGNSPEGAEIRVTAGCEEGRLRVEVYDDGPGFEAARDGKPGHGLDLLQRRLTALFGRAAELEVDGRAGATRVAICVAV